MDNLTGFGCLGSLCLVPIVTFVVGLLIGGNRLPWRVRFERNEKREYEVDDDSPKWQ